LETGSAVAHQYLAAGLITGAALYLQNEASIVTCAATWELEIA
jgi:hypothetical protein